jgi:hypothetical protein
MSQIHVERIRATFERLYSGLIDISDLNSRPDKEQKDAFLSRSLAAYALTCAAGIDEVKASKCVVDGGKDNGIDAIYIDE